jgi:hypothetical protein
MTLGVIPFTPGDGGTFPIELVIAGFSGYARSFLLREIVNLQRSPIASTP